MNLINIKTASLKVFFLDEFSPLGDRKKGKGECNLCQEIFWENWPKLTIFKGDTIEITNFNTRSSMSPQ
jgi:hypothetical protein